MIPKEINLIIDKICRSCLCETGEMYNVFEKLITTTPMETKEAVLLCDMLMACTSLQVVAGDGLPKLLCTNCESKLTLAFEFKQLCETSHIKLKELIHPNEISMNKQENIIVQPDVPKDFTSEEDDKDNLPEQFPSNKLSMTTCPYCMKELTCTKGLKLHVKKHIDDGMNYCPLCPVKNIRTKPLIKHMKTHDKKKLNLKHSCKICSKIFAISSDLFEHMKIHIEEVQKYNKKEVSEDVKEIKKEKDVCVKNEEEVVVLKKDDSIKNEDNTTINESPFDNRFPVSESEQQNDLDDTEDEDLLIEKVPTKRKRGRPSADKVSTIFECKDCNKTLTTYAGLCLHSRKHTGIDLVCCEHCNKSFTTNNHLNKHLRSHGIIVKKVKTDKKVRECEFCDRKFKYKKSYQHHMQIEHGMSDVESENEKEKSVITNIKNEGNDESNNTNGGDSTDDSVERLVIKIDNVSDKEENEKVTTMETEIDPPEITEAESELDAAEQEECKKRKVKSHICHVCGVQFSRSNHLTRHMVLHRSVLKHRCEKCDQAYLTEELLKKHVEEQHINKPYVCTTCNKPFGRGEHLIRHLKLHQTHTDEEHKCSICDLSFARSDLLARHTKGHLMQDKRHICIQCGKAFNRLDNLKTHQKVHSGLKDTSKLHLCVYCGKEFNNSSNMIVHMRRHTGERPYKCTSCGKGFPRSHDLKCHERTHSGEKPYLCTLCGKSFNKSNKLLRHSRVHTGERPYVCSLCSRAFTQSNDLSLHMRRHTGARPYACGVCPARFIQSGQLKNHRRATGHWMETQPDLKGGHRVEPVVSAVEPVPIRFKAFGKTRLLKMENDLLAQQELFERSAEQQQPVEENVQDLPVTEITTQPQRILMGVTGDIKLQTDGTVTHQPIIIDGTKLVELPGGQLELVTLPTILHGANGEEIKLKTEISNLNLAAAATAELHKLNRTSSTTTNSFSNDNSSIVFTTVQTSTYTSQETFPTFQSFS